MTTKSNSYRRSSYNYQCPATNNIQTHNIKFYKHQIKTTVTKYPNVVSEWIYNIEKSYHRHLKRLIVRLDTEWQIRYNGGNESKVAIMQICVGSHCLIFQIIHSSYIPPSLINFMNNHNYTFTGVGVRDDLNKLKNEYGIGYNAQLTDLRTLAEKIYGSGAKYWGLKRLTNIVLEYDSQKPKRITLSPWAKYKLSYEQVEYACCIRLI
uniref:Werner Syndrome-like exonuclease n=1 Tax=Erigeron canadensis TaxID=72917 RepID=UPI001CB8DCFA|nr:Werner Syndrome-like exonuclease [Erigeron canadensis]